ncbi:regulatory inactivation of DnaA Hda protein [Nitrosomonas eutropha]|uniref:Regulatory inactivation of DnaA Hda protein n=1 Tax=Nitrosomonas eutropha TaxID=916 RepID=A0A1I7H7L7_9PROT|nr:DnaA regulatory inactivator Hda [Nitrosomonas eutropha]SFU56476.1 regulatory inactivation of DnaA Hda protein [Nitrosomonas eutropha]
MRQLLLDITEIGPPSLNNFIPEGNEELLYTLKNLVANNRQDRFYYLWGKTGSGKSHLLQAVTNIFLEQQRNTHYIDCNQADEIDFSLNADCIAVDNIEQLDDAEQIRLFNLYNQIRESEYGIFLASGTQPPAQLDLRQDLATRLGWGLVYQVHELTDEKKIEVMQDYAIRCGFELPLDVCNYLLKHEQRDLSSLIRQVSALDQLSLARQRPVTLPLLRELL